MPDCNDCKERRAHPDVPWEIFQAEQARANLANRRWFIAWIITFVLLLGTVLFIFWQQSQYEHFENEYTQEIDTGSGDFDAETIINRGGVYYYGEDQADGEDQRLPEEDWR